MSEGKKPEVSPEDYDDSYVYETVPCDACNGTGLAPEGWDCEECDGLGYWDA